ncbi:cell adhesion molecule Dscam1, partial [Halyomorpha halys]|uniref:cell adhesion molecule Dscam1 n=1 Tax=Halyomorpha halys TaxID=286706 RepID=UPI0006D4E269
GGTHKHVLSPSEEEFETDQIVDGGTYQFWVTASTNIGEGASTRVVTVTPGNKTKIMSFSQHIVTPWKQNLTLPCQTVGIPPPKISWDFEGIQIEAKSNRFEVRKDGVLNIRDIQHPDRGNYNCNAENLHGNDKIVYKVIVRVPPDPPLLHVIKADINSLHLKWTNQGNNDVPILGRKAVHGEAAEEPVLAFPDFTRQFTITTDASDYALGAVLSQNGKGGDRPVAFTWRGFKWITIIDLFSKAVMAHQVQEKSSEAVLAALRMWFQFYGVHLFRFRQRIRQCHDTK